MRIALKIEYDGTHYAGWQYQPHCPSIQAKVEAALSQIAAEPIRTVAAGRTDAGVHALEQIVHFDTTAQRPKRAWVQGANALLPEDVRILDAWPVDPSFHARRQALARWYRYRILNRGVASALLRRQVTWWYHDLNIKNMEQGAAYLLGEHDFSSFRGPYCQSKSPIRRVYLLEVSRAGEEVWIDVVANAFLHNMVRNLVGVLMAIGSGRQPPEWAKAVLEARRRSAGGVTAPAQGLCLAGVLYPERFRLPRQTIFDRLPRSLKRVEEEDEFASSSN